MRMTPPRMDALPENSVPNFLPMFRPAMQRKKVTTAMMMDAASAISQPYSEMVKPTERRRCWCYALHEQGTGTELGGLLGLLALDAVHQHLAADVAQQGQRDPRMNVSKDENSSTMVCTQIQPVMGITAWNTPKVPAILHMVSLPILGHADRLPWTPKTHPSPDLRPAGHC